MTVAELVLILQSVTNQNAVVVTNGNFEDDHVPIQNVAEGHYDKETFTFGVMENPTEETLLKTVPAVFIA